jgi:hypothetical protein
MNSSMDATMRRLITATLLVLSMSAHPAIAGSKLYVAPNVDPELSPPGLEVPGLSKPRPDKPRKTQQSRRPPVPPGLRPVSPEVARRLDQARGAGAWGSGPVAMTPPPAPTQTPPSPLLPRQLPRVKVEPNPERIIGSLRKRVDYDYARGQPTMRKILTGAAPSTSAFARHRQLAGIVTLPNDLTASEVHFTSSPDMAPARRRRGPRGRTMRRRLRRRSAR